MVNPGTIFAMLTTAFVFAAIYVINPNFANLTFDYFWKIALLLVGGSVTVIIAYKVVAGSGD